jgi:hypothetical protein
VATEVHLRRLRAIQKGSRSGISRLAMLSRKPMLKKKKKKKTIFAPLVIYTHVFVPFFSSLHSFLARFHTFYKKNYIKIKKKIENKKKKKF